MSLACCSSFNLMSAKPHQCCKCCDLYQPMTCCNLHMPSLSAPMFNHKLGEPSTKWLPQHVKPNYKKDINHSPQDFIQLIDWEERSCYAAVLLPIIHQVFPLPVQPHAQLLLQQKLMLQFTLA